MSIRLGVLRRRTEGRPDTWRLLLPFVSRHYGALVGAGVSTVAMTAAALAAPWPLKFAIDHLAERSGEVP